MMRIRTGKPIAGTPLSAAQEADGALKTCPAPLAPLLAAGQIVSDYEAPAEIEPRWVP